MTPSKRLTDAHIYALMAVSTLFQGWSWMTADNTALSWSLMAASFALAVPTIILMKKHGWFTTTTESDTR